MENWSTIITFDKIHEAHLAKGYLESEGVDCIIMDELTVQVNNFYANAIGGVKVVVKNEDFERGIQILKKGGYIYCNEMVKDFKIETVVAEKYTDKRKCPFCFSENIAKMKEPNIATVLVFFLLGAFFPIFKTSMKCFECGRVWKYKNR